MGGSGVLGNFLHIAVEHGHCLLKECIFSGVLEKICQKGVRHGIFADGQIVGFAQIPVVLGVEGIHEGENVCDGSVFDGSHQVWNVFIVVVKGASHDAGLLDDVGHRDFI